MKILATSFLLISLSSVYAELAAIDKQNVYRNDITVTSSNTKESSSAAIQSVRHAVKTDFERIVLDFSDNFSKTGDITTPLSLNSKVDTPPRYQAAYTSSPYAILVEYNTRRGLGTLPDFSKSKLIKHIYSIPTLDDATARIAIIFKQHIKAEIFELHKPGRLVIDVKPEPSPKTHIYVVRTKATNNIESIGHLEEIFVTEQNRGNKGIQKLWKPAIRRTDDGKQFCLEVAYTAELRKASVHLEGWSPELRKKLIIEKRLTSAEPAAKPTHVSGK